MLRSNSSFIFLSSFTTTSAEKIARVILVSLTSSMSTFSAWGIGLGARCGVTNPNIDKEEKKELEGCA